MHIKIKVYTGSKKEEIIRVSEYKFECRVKEKPERNLANKKMLTLLANFLEVPAGRLKIVSGHHTFSKIILLREKEDN